VPVRCALKSIDLSRARERPGRAAGAALFVTAENVLSDCTPRVPKLSGDLRGSGRTRAAGDLRVVVEWGTDADTAAYARPQYYGNFNHPNQPGVQSPARWFDEAEREDGRRWVQLFDHELKARV